ncbi:MAG: TIGR03936 family radical SAM-associated protein, partial [Spirochaetaceae bacterium]|nr:TIGR03936 family radical SAM-associated protein [Spirochaetaceae bacterium]MCF7950186.1 TIGR03936 family radical SAM-associated protein [Spirochaetaceae bacterium]
FCHAGYFYRPYRQKSVAAIIEEIDFYVYELGYREITLSSLSSGDYVGLHQLVRTLNARYQGLGVSFALPSLHVNSFTLPLLQEVSKIRKSGLTFAVETPHQEWQRSINKEVTAEKVNEILLEARRRGWNLAKFYFMVGLPEHLYEGANEAEAIIEYLQQVRKVSKFKLNVNIGTFIPKPHTPYQWSRQLTEEQALERIKQVREAFHKTPVRVNYHSPFISYLEGVISRGDSRVGPLIEDAYRRGARLDAWEEHVSFDIWRAALEAQNWNVEQESCRERDIDEELPWKKVDIGVSQPFLKSELEKSKQHELTNACVFPCDHHCGVCVQGTRPLAAAEQSQDDESAESTAIEETDDGYWYLFSFSKQGKARYLSHINIMTIFERSFQRAGIGLEYTSGFNPKPRMEFAHPLTLGIASKAEISRCKLIAVHEAAEVISSMNRALPEGIQITRLQQMPGQKGRGRGQSLMALHAASTYLIKGLPESKYIQNSASGDAASEIEKLSEKIINFLEDKKADKNLLELVSDKEETASEVPLIKLHIPTQGVGKFNLKELCTYTHGTIGEFLSSFSIEREQLLMEPPESYSEQPGEFFDYFRLVRAPTV